jgi:hypothetical protein
MQGHSSSCTTLRESMEVLRPRSAIHFQQIPYVRRGCKRRRKEAMIGVEVQMIVLLSVGRMKRARWRRVVWRFGVCEERTGDSQSLIIVVFLR